MTKLKTLRTLPPALPIQLSNNWQQALDTVQGLDQTLIRLDQTIATAIARMMDQGDAIALELEPLLTLRQQVAELLTDLGMQSKQCCEAAKTATIAAETAESAVREAARSLANAYARCSKPAWWKYLAVGALSGGLVIGSLKAWPSLGIQPPVIQIDANSSAQQIAAELYRIAQEQRRTLAAQRPQ